MCFFLKEEDGLRKSVATRGLGDVCKRQRFGWPRKKKKKAAPRRAALGLGPRAQYPTHSRSNSYSQMHIQNQSQSQRKGRAGAIAIESEPPKYGENLQPK